MRSTQLAARRLFSGILCALVLALAIPAAVAQARPTHDGKIALFGTLHAHSTLSGDVGSDEGLAPADCYEADRLVGLDFLGMSDHHRPTGHPGGYKYNLSAAQYDQVQAAATKADHLHAGSTAVSGSRRSRACGARSMVSIQL